MNKRQRIVRGAWAETQVPDRQLNLALNILTSLGDKSFTRKEAQLLMRERDFSRYFSDCSLAFDALVSKGVIVRGNRLINQGPLTYSLIYRRWCDPL